MGPRSRSRFSGVTPAWASRARRSAWVLRETIRAVIEAAHDSPAPFVRAAYAADGAPNPVLVRRAAWAMAAGIAGDRGLGPLLAARPELVLAVPVPGANPDVDTPADLAALQPAEASS